MVPRSVLFWVEIMLEVRQDRRNIILVNLFSVEAFKYTLGSLINDYGGARALFKRFKPRGETVSFSLLIWFMGVV